MTSPFRQEPDRIRGKKGRKFRNNGSTILERAEMFSLTQKKFKKTSCKAPTEQTQHSTQRNAAEDFLSATSK